MSTGMEQARPYPNFAPEALIGAAVGEGTGAGRIASVDLVRGLAIVLMVAANAAGELLVQPHPLWFRLYGSFAAPIFVTLAGMMVAVAAASGRRGLGYFAQRGALLVLIAMLLDVTLEGWLPFNGFDVLYVLGLSLPIAYFVARSPVRVRWALPLAIFAATPALQSLLGYRLDMPMIARDTPAADWSALVPSALCRLVIDGWFPLFPWLGFALLGVALDAWRRSPAPRVAPDLRAGLAILAVGAAVWMLFPGAMTTRKGYSELFYPATIGFVVTSAGLIVALLALGNSWEQRLDGKVLRQFGRCSMMLYLLHLVLIEYLWRPIVGPSNIELAPFLAVYAAFLVLLWVVAAWTNVVKQVLRERGQPVPELLAFFIGK